MGKRNVREYTEEFKRSSVELAMTSGESMNQIAKNLGISTRTLDGWIRKYGAKLKQGTQLVDQGKLLEELKALGKETSRLRQERDILRKGTAYFAKETQ